MTQQRSVFALLRMRSVVVCFLIPWGVQVLLLAVLACAPQDFFSAVLAPPIRFFAGESVLHYPQHLWWLYHVMPNVHALAMLCSGAALSGAAARIVGQARSGRAIALRDALLKGLSLWHCVWIWLAAWALTWAISRGVARGLGHGAAAGVTLIAVLAALQCAVVYAIPASALSGHAVWRALPASVRQALRHPLTTLRIVAGPIAAVLLVSVALSESRVSGWMVRYAPEAVVLPMIVRLLVWSVSDAYMTVAAADVWCRTQGITHE